jgi:hypothetical protein
VVSRRVPLSAALGVLSLLAGTSCHPRPGAELWSYRRDGCGSQEAASAVITLPNGDVYAAGYIDSRDGNYVFTVAALTSSGGERWLFTLDSLSNAGTTHFSYANALACDGEGNLYVTGSSQSRMVVVSLSPGGSERWIYRPPALDPSVNEGLSIVCGSDGNIYAAGRTSDGTTHGGFTIASVTPDGRERWVYNRHGYGAFALAWGADGNVYAAGDVESLGFALVSLSPDGTERWLRDAGQAGGMATSLAFGCEGSILAAGQLPGRQIGVASYTPAGEQLWVWQRPIGNTSTPAMCAVASDDQGNAYFAGYTTAGSGERDTARFTVAGIDNDGHQQWLYFDPTPCTEIRAGQGIVVGPDGNVYCTGSPDGVATVVMGFGGDGSPRWSHSLETAWGPSSVGGLTFGTDGNLCVAGSSTGFLTDADFVVTCLEPGNQE